MIAGIAVSTLALAQDANHILIDGWSYDIRTGSSHDAARALREEREDTSGGATVLRGNNTAGLEAKVRLGRERVQQALVAAGCVRSDESDLSRHDCYVNSDGHLVHRPASDDNGRPQGDSALCRDGTYSFSEHATGTCSHHGGVQRN
jgi:hypothetical protein